MSLRETFNSILEGTLIQINCAPPGSLPYPTRAFAEVGHSHHREDRLKLADHLERRTLELERRAADERAYAC
jgi:hypothetical protein